MSGEPASQRYFLSQLSVLADGMKGLTTQIARQVETMGRYDVEFIKLARSDIQLRSDLSELKIAIGELKSDISQFRLSNELQLQAILKRIDSLEGRTHDIADHVQELRSDSLRQYNDVINAVQDSYQNRMSLEDIEERLAELERIVLSRQPPAA
jgi:chromosome segregation ATPase